MPALLFIYVFVNEASTKIRNVRLHLTGSSKVHSSGVMIAEANQYQKSCKHFY